jgi:hypothetical protein
MKKLELFLPRILPWCLGAPEPLIHQALLDSASQFCEETAAIHYITDPITIVAGVADYDIGLPQSNDLSRILRVWFGEDPWATPAGIPLNWVVTDLSQITIFPTPAAELAPGQFMFADVAVKPSRNATVLDDRLYNDWLEGIVGGAIARLCATPDQPYTNPANAALGAATFKLWRGKAQYESTKGRVRRDTTVKMRPFA